MEVVLGFRFLIILIILLIKLLPWRLGLNLPLMEEVIFCQIEDIMAMKAIYWNTMTGIVGLDGQYGQIIIVAAGMVTHN